MNQAQTQGTFSMTISNIAAAGPTNNIAAVTGSNENFKCLARYDQANTAGTAVSVKFVSLLLA